MAANQVPWLNWVGNDRWECTRCGEEGDFPQEDLSTTELIYFVKSVKDQHSACKEPDLAKIERILQNGRKSVKK